MSVHVRRLTAVVFLFSATLGFAQNIKIISPSATAASSRVRVVAEFSSTAPIDAISVLVDNVEVSRPEPVTPLDVTIPMSAGNHILTINARQSDGLQLSSSRSVEVATRAVASNVTPDGASSGSSGGTTWYSNIEEMSGWYTYPDQGSPTCSSKPSLTSSPSKDGISGKFYLGPKGQFNNCLWPIKLGSSTTATHFTLDTYYQLSNPSAAQGVEFSSNKHIGSKWYKFSVQCSYNKGIFSVWNTAGANWSPTSIPCNRPAQGSWDHLTVQTEISNGKAVFLSITLNGVQHNVNQSFYPSNQPSSYSYGVHFQMDGNRAGNAYYAWVDELKYTVW